MVYKSLKQFDYFLFVKKEDEFARVPDGLRQILGVLEKVMDLELDENRSLAQADIVAVMQQIEERGYYLQMPPQSDSASLDA
ncbi:MAG: YcgL domain-containing protein [Pseudomonadota bacterium]|nr:YcgL domain-containing protein [Pseudomonadota bacterium]